MDFKLGIYQKLAATLQYKQYSFIGFKDYIIIYPDKILKGYIILRHDVDRLPRNALKLAQIENGLGIHGTYYFRVVPESFDHRIIEQIAKLGHEIGYHYEDIDLAVKRQKALGIKITNEEELIDMAMESFVNNLEKLRKICLIKTICMHGSPMSRYDNRLLWKKYNYRDYGIIGEPYFDLDFDEVLYLTDTGRRWNAGSVSIRDKVDSKFKYNFRTTDDIIKNIDSLPPKVMLNVHPQRWHDSNVPWIKELLWQNIKNVGKLLLVKQRY